MKYIYDLLLNFNDELYEIHEWVLTDAVEHIRKIPLYKVSDKEYLDIKNNDIVLGREMINNIKNATEVFERDNVKIIDYAFLITSGKEVIAIEFNEQGKSIAKSKLLLDEETDILLISSKMNIISIKYKIIKQNDVFILETRAEREKKLFLNREIKNIFDEKNIDKLKYIYYECFNELCLEINSIYNKLTVLIGLEWNVKHEKLYELLKLPYTV